MARKYHGPLLPGQRSAKVPRGKKGKNLPSRSRVSSTRTTVTKAVSKALANYGENKFKGTQNSCLTPVPKPAGAQSLTYVFQNASNSIAGVLPEFTNARVMGLFAFPQGDANNQRTGDYMYIRQSHIKFEIQMLPVNTENTPSALNATTDFRFMVVKANRKYNPLARYPDPGGDLFLDTENKAFGYDSTTATTFMNMNQPINKRDFLVYADKRFTLSPPSAILDDANQEITSTQNPAYPIKKSITIKLPVWKKCHFDLVNNVPDNLDTQWLVICQAVPSAYCDAVYTEPNRSWVLSSYGTTSARDS